MRLVIDASVAIKLFVEELGSSEAFAVMERPAERLAPDWMRVEVASALWNRVRRTGLPEDQARAALAGLPAFIEEFVPSAPLLNEAVDLSYRIIHPVYDCIYLALAIREQGTVVTADGELRKAAHRAGLGEHVELLTWPK